MLRRHQHPLLPAALVLASVLLNTVDAQIPIPSQLPSTFPHNYTGIPAGGYSPEWQDYFRVTGDLANVTRGSTSTSYAGNIGVNRDGHPNNTLWFWAFERTSEGGNGSLTAAAGERENEPWMVWLNGGPGASSSLGLLTENGPLQVTGDFNIVTNNFSWNHLADVIWVDQPVGTGFSTSDADGYVSGDDQLGEDFVQFLSNVVRVFPSLAKRPFYLTGESYSGTYIPYITKAILNTENPPVNLKKIAIGDGTIGDFALYEELSTVNTLEAWPQIINFDPDVLQYFRVQEHLCGYDVNLTYPQQGIIPTLTDPFTTGFVYGAVNGTTDFRQRSRSRLGYSNSLRFADRLSTTGQGRRSLHSPREVREEAARAWKRDLSARPNGTLDPFYGCFLFEEMVDYAINFTFPWSGFTGFDVYDIPDALNPEVPADPTVFLNDNTTRQSLHAPDKIWEEIFEFPYGNSTEGNPFGDPSVAPMAFMSELAANASKKGVGIVIYEGNNDALVAHRQAEVVIQNMTFGGTQGFTRKPATPMHDDNGNFVGIIHQERNLTYAFFPNAGHFVPRSQPEAALVFVREFILGNNKTGLVQASGTVVGGEVPSLSVDVYQGINSIFYGTGAQPTTTGTLTFPSETWASWNSFLATATKAIVIGGNSGTGSDGNGNGSGDGNNDSSAQMVRSNMGLGVLLSVCLGWWMVWVR
ncbi:alpha/beta-hydrolase [Dendrothele bispora CBS 962.96]|uniref:Alpha/beta-hydrolase n=1 Tax=Dendrothele bispora (strain CBS 962.96) TaxID=1314807 RepID=A0A4S8M4X2_DENBC|nr:alpha/beta-hydrolase [Dendrothele bispora CBS 962.96]